MRNIPIVCLLVCFGLASSAFAGSGVKQCVAYATACKAEKSIQQLPKNSKLAAIHSCIIEKATADGANGAACLKEQSGHKAQ